MEVDFEITPEVEAFTHKHNAPISIDEIATGICLCLSNAKELYLDANALAETGRHGRTMSMLIAAMEEVGKITVLSSMARLPKCNLPLWKDAWNSFRCHKTKSTCAFAQTYEDYLRAFPKAFEQILSYQAGLAPFAERLRQVGLYVDFLGDDAGWMSPIAVAPKDTARWFEYVERALERVISFDELGMHSVELLQIEHEIYAPLSIGRPRSKDMTAEQRNALIEAANAARVHFVRRLVTDGFVELNSDFQIMGIPIRDYIKQGNP